MGQRGRLDGYMGQEDGTMDEMRGIEIRRDGKGRWKKEGREGAMRKG